MAGKLFIHQLTHTNGKYAISMESVVDYNSANIQKPLGRAWRLQSIPGFDIFEINLAYPDGQVGTMTAERLLRVSKYVVITMNLLLPSSIDISEPQKQKPLSDPLLLTEVVEPSPILNFATPITDRTLTMFNQSRKAVDEHWFDESTDHVCKLWKNKGGDWLDAIGTPQGDKPWSVSLQVASGQGFGSIVMNVTELIKFADLNNFPYSIILKQRAKGSITIVGAMNSTGAALHSLVLHYEDGTSGTCSIWYTCSLDAGSTTNDHDDFLNVNETLFLEFVRLDKKPILKAELTIQYISTSFGPTQFAAMLGN